MQFDQLKRRDFITLAGGAAWPLAARAQQTERVRRVGALMHLEANDREGQDRLSAFRQGLRQLGWIDGRNMQIDTRWGANDADRRRYATELVARSPDVILASTTLAMVALQQTTNSVPIVFTNVTDPVAAGFVGSMAKPGGNVTGFTTFEFTTSAKWLELLREVAPQVTRAIVVRDPTIASAVSQFAVIQSAAAHIPGFEVSPVSARDSAEIERAVTSFLRLPNGGLIVTASAFGLAQRDMLVSIAMRHRLPAVYPFDYFVSGGGLLSYGPDSVNQYRQAATYVDRILKGESPSNLPVQAPTRYRLAINLKTAEALGLSIPTDVLVRADEVIE
jgi:putative tryptophan/tyrosine transport system substrate-binding protein